MSGQRQTSAINSEQRTIGNLLGDKRFLRVPAYQRSFSWTKSEVSDQTPAVIPDKNGKFTTTLELENGRDYRFRYLVDENHWMNDWNADKYVQNPYGGDDSVVSV